MAQLIGAAHTDLPKCTAPHDLIEQGAENGPIYGLGGAHPSHGGSGGTYCPQFPVLGVDAVTGARYVVGGYFVPTGDYTGYYFIVNETVVTGGGALLFDWQGILQTYGDWPTAKFDTMPWPPPRTCIPSTLCHS
jgi:hypothetical protein